MAAHGERAGGEGGLPAASVPVPNTVAPSLNVTVPVAAAVTVAVKVTEP